MTIRRIGLLAFMLMVPRTTGFAGNLEARSCPSPSLPYFAVVDGRIADISRNLLRTHSPDDAIRILDAARPQWPDCSAVQITRALAHAIADRRDLAKKYLHQALRGQDRNADVLAAAADVHELLGERLPTITYLLKAYYNDPGSEALAMRLQRYKLEMFPQDTGQDAGGGSFPILQEPSRARRVVAEGRVKSSVLRPGE